MIVRTAVIARRRLNGAPPAASLVEQVGRTLQRVPVLSANPARLMGEQAVFSVIGSAFAFVWTSGWRGIVGMPVGAVMGWRAGPWVQARSERKADRASAAAVPDLLDRLTMCVQSGMSIDRALRVVGERLSGPLGHVWRDGIRALDAGVPRREAYERIAAGTSCSEVRDLLNLLSRSEALGVAVSEALSIHATDLRARARAAAEAEARTAPVKLIFPLVFCFLPAFVLLTIAPIALSAIRTLGGL